jgi:hypothetical protein
MARKLGDGDIARLQTMARTLRGWRPDIALERFAERGIVIAAGGAGVFTNAYVLVSVLRGALGCRLPIEVWHLGAAEMSPAMAALLEELDVTVVDAEPLIRQQADDIRDGWQLKPFAMLWSRFAEVLLLDADQVPVRDPADCFDWPDYLRTGAVFWPDIVDLSASNPVWTALELPGRTTPSMESGQILIDKRKCLRALAVTVRLNAAAELLYEVIYGDKDSFLLGWELVGQPFTLVPHRPFRDERMLVQRDFAGAPLFQHRTAAKWHYGGSQHRLENFRHEAACLEALARLERRWNGRVVHLPDRSAAARRAEAELVACGALDLAIDQEEHVMLELLPFGEIAEGRSVDRQNWWCSEGPAGLLLRLGRPENITYEFRKAGGGYWTGTRLRSPQVPAQLVPLTVAPPHVVDAPGLADELLRAARLGGPNEDGAALAATLELLGRVEPGVISRLRHLLPTLPDGTGPVLAQILDGLDAQSRPGRRNVRADAGVLGAGYTRDIDDGGG